jgi:hypothetical protein
LYTYDLAVSLLEAGIPADRSECIGRLVMKKEAAVRWRIYKDANIW